MSTELKALASEIAGAVSTIKTNNEEFKTRFDNLQRQVDAIDVATKSIPHRDGPQTSPLLKCLEEGGGDELGRLLKSKRGKVVVEIKGGLMQQKTVLTENFTGSVGSDTAVSAGLMQTGVLPIDRTGGITTEARRRLRVRDVLASSPTDSAIVDMVKVSTPMSIASPVAEASLKPENQLNLSSNSERVKTIAHYLIASRQILDDMPALAQFISTSGVYYLGLAEELQLLSGDNTGENLHGLIPQASAFNTGLLPSLAKGWNKIDVIGAAIEQVAIRRGALTAQGRYPVARSRGRLRVRRR
jgi:HK97 family phage major capsid protein